MNLPNFLQRLIDEYVPRFNLGDEYIAGIHDAYKATWDTPGGKRLCAALNEIDHLNEKIRALELRCKELEHDLKILSTGDMP